MQGLGAVVAGAEAEAFAGKNVRQIMRVDALCNKADAAVEEPGIVRAEDGDFFERREHSECGIDQRLLMVLRLLRIDRFQPCDRGLQSGRFRDPASNRCGESSGVNPSFVTVRIIPPPPRNGGIDSSNSSFAYITPIPVGP